MSHFEWTAAPGTTPPAWWRVERDDCGQMLGRRVRAVSDRDTSPEVPLSLRDPGHCEACDLDVAHTGAWHRQFVPFRPSPFAGLLHRPAADPLRA